VAWDRQGATACGLVWEAPLGTAASRRDRRFPHWLFPIRGIIWLLQVVGARTVLLRLSIPDNSPLSIHLSFRCLRILPMQR
jgi:hypothetical protein